LSGIENTMRSRTLEPDAESFEPGRSGRSAAPGVSHRLRQGPCIIAALLGWLDQGRSTMVDLSTEMV
jgi:hypothetical protein